MRYRELQIRKKYGLSQNQVFNGILAVFGLGSE